MVQKLKTPKKKIIQIRTLFSKAGKIPLSQFNRFRTQTNFRKRDMFSWSQNTRKSSKLKIMFHCGIVKKSSKVVEGE